MTTPPTLTAFEEKLARSLREEAAEPTPDCFPEETLWEFVEQGGKHPDALNLIRHISSCAYCTQGYFAMKELLQLRRELAPAAEAGQEGTSQESASPAGNSAPSLLERLRTGWRVPAIRFRFQLGGMAVAGAAATVLLLWPRLTQNHFGPTPDAGLVRSLKQFQEDNQHLHAEIVRLSQQSQTDLQTQNKNEALEKALKTAKQALAAAQIKEKLLATQNQSQQSRPALPGEFVTKPNSPEQIITDSQGNSVYVIPVDRKESLPLRTNSLALPVHYLASLTRTGGTTMSGSGEEPIALLRPSRTFVSSLRPTFTWKTVPQASAYILTCIPKNSQADKITYTVSADPKDSKPDFEWTISPKSRSLQASTTYTWTVEALDAQKARIVTSSKNEELLFRTLSNSEVTEIERKSKQYVNAPLLMGVLYARLGVLEEAEKAFTRYLQAKPSDETAHKMLGQVKAQETPRP